MLNTKEIIKFFLQPELSLTVDDKYNKKVIRVTTANDKFIYIKKSTDTNPLVLHPKLRSKKDEIEKINGLTVDWSGTHNDNFSGYDKKINKGKEPSYYGFDVEIHKASALTQLLKIIDPLASIQISSTLDEITAAEPSLPADETSRKTIINARIGQGKFREDLIKHWSNCAVTGARNILLLKASHIKPWKDSDNIERLDPFNGFLLSANLDAAFDAGLISFNDSGAIIVSELFDDAADFGISTSLSLRDIHEKHKPYLQHHRNTVFKG